MSVVLSLLRPRRLVRCVDVLAVQPGFGGQRFDSGVLAKVEELRSICPELDIQVNLRRSTEFCRERRVQDVRKAFEQSMGWVTCMHFLPFVHVSAWTFESPCCRCGGVKVYGAQRCTLYVAFTIHRAPPAFPRLSLTCRRFKVDGGVSAATAQACVAAGANVLTSGSFIFGDSAKNTDKDVAAKTIAELRGSLNARWPSPAA